MCEANVYLIDKNRNEDLTPESVDRILPVGDTFEMENIFSQRKTVKAILKEMNLVDHCILLGQD